MDIELLKKILMDNRRIIGRVEFVERDILLEEGLNYVFVGLERKETYKGAFAISSARKL